MINKRILVFVTIVLFSQSANASWKLALETAKFSSKYGKELVVKVKDFAVTQARNSGITDRIIKGREQVRAQVVNLQNKFNVHHKDQTSDGVVQESKSMNAPTTYFGTSKTEANITNNFNARTTYWDVLERTGSKGVALFNGLVGSVIGWNAHAFTAKPQEKIIVITQEQN